MNHLTDVRTEESVIANLIGRPELIDEVRNHLDTESFSSQPCRKIWEAMVYYVGIGKTPDLPYLQANFGDRENSTDLDNLNRIAASPVSADIFQQVEILEVRRKRRVYHDLRVKLMENEGGDIGELQRIVGKATEKIDKFTASNIIDKFGLMNHAVSVINKNLESDGQAAIYTGFRILDELGGLPPESEVIIAAFSSQGKTAFALTLLDTAMKNGVETALYSAEMGLSSIAGRFLNMMGWGVSITKFKTQPLLGNTIEDFNRLSQDFVNRTGNIHIDTSSTNSPDYICSSIRVLYRKYGIRLVVIDYLQLISIYDESGASDQERLAVASRKFQAVAKELAIVIVVLSQFSRPPRGEEKTQAHQPSDDLIRGSGQIYEACDIALYIYRPEKWNETYPYPFEKAVTKDTAMIKIGKFRDGESNRAAIVGFDGPKTLFYDFPEGFYSDDPKNNYPQGNVPIAPPPTNPIPQSINSNDENPF